MVAHAFVGEYKSIMTYANQTEQGTFLEGSHRVFGLFA